MSAAAFKITDAYVRDVANEDDVKTIDIAWSTERHGFGVLTLVQDKDKISIRSLYGSPDFAKSVLCKLVDLAEIV